MTDAPLRLHWWKAVPNFGDALSQLVVAHVSGREVVHVGPRKAELWAIGSMMHVVRKNREDFAVRPTIWGTGQLGHVPRDVLAHVDVALLRGPLGAALLGVEARRFGDPGLLAPALLGDLPAQSDHVGLVPHHSQLEDPGLAQLLAHEPCLRLIDVRDDCLDVCRQIASCAHVVASSLHGLIVADALGVPNTWLSPGSNSGFKYYDYAASVGRALPLPMTLADLKVGLGRLPSPERLSYGEGVSAAQEALYESFPAHLKAAHILAEAG